MVTRQRGQGEEGVAQTEAFPCPHWWVVRLGGGTWKSPSLYHHVLVPLHMSKKRIECVLFCFVFVSLEKMA